MPRTLKFSQFVDGGPLTAGQLPVGLNAIPGVNTIWNFTGGGGGGGGAVTQTINQTTPILTISQWVRINAAGQYVPALGDNAQDAEVIGVVVATPAPEEYTIQQSGYISTAMNVFNLAPPTPGQGWFLSTVTPGAMVNTDANVNGTVSRPVFVNETATSGWVLPYRGLIVGGAAPAGGGGGGTNPNVVTVNQTGHGFVAGDVIYIAGGAPIDYQKSFGDSLAHAQAVGVVTNVISANSFTYQFSGYNTGAITQDDLGAPIVPGGVYYVSVLTPGKISLNIPIVNGQASRPIYIAEQTAATTGTDAGLILPQRPLEVTGNPPPPAQPALVAVNAPGPFIGNVAGWINTGICGTITTLTNTQNVLILAKINLASDGSNGVAYKIQRNGVDIDMGTVVGSRTAAGGVSLGQIAEVDSGISTFDCFIDSPALAGMYTYCILVNRGSSSVANVNLGASDANSASSFRTTSNLVLSRSGA